MNKNIHQNLGNICLEFNCAKCKKLDATIVTTLYESVRIGSLIGANSMYCYDCLMAFSLDQLDNSINHVPKIKINWE